jgi:hypothetical protein
MLPLAGPPMYDFVFVWDRHEQTPIITQFVTWEAINAFCGSRVCKEESFYTLVFHFGLSG